ncbi:hypothetical protein GCM10020221_15900 [Streptomyces thioluteus]|uniref:Uncharacterized protein n=1 Tax=Streptomyces thioluteus TaxID=66431 RepID=A0ABN3WLV2_STRTU
MTPRTADAGARGARADGAYGGAARGERIGAPGAHGAGAGGASEAAGAAGPRPGTPGYATGSGPRQWTSGAAAPRGDAEPAAHHGGPEGGTRVPVPAARRSAVPPRDPAATVPRPNGPEERTPPRGVPTTEQRPGAGETPAWGARTPVYGTGAGTAGSRAAQDAAGAVTTVTGTGDARLRAPQQRTEEPSWTAGAAPADTSTALGTARIHPGPGPGTGTAEAPPAADGKRSRNRGIAAWARRLAGGRAGQQPRPEDDGGQGFVPAPREPAPEETSAALRERWPDPATVLLTALGPGPRLWERGPDHPDLLTVRLGTADRYVSGPHGGEGALLPAVPVTVGLRQAGSLGLAGPRVRLAGLARSVLAQLAVLHSPSVLEYVLIAADPLRAAAERQAEWAWLGWLPQLRPAHGQDCRLLVAYDREQAAARTAELVRRLDDGPLGPSWPTAAEEKVAALAEAHRGPRTVVVVDGDPGTPALRESLARLAARGGAAGIHLICLADAPSTTASSPVSAALETARAASPAFPYCGAVALVGGDVATVVQVIGSAPRGGAGRAGAGQHGRRGPRRGVGGVGGALRAGAGAAARGGLGRGRRPFGAGRGPAPHRAAAGRAGPGPGHPRLADGALGLGHGPGQPPGRPGRRRPGRGPARPAVGGPGRGRAASAGGGRPRQREDRAAALARRVARGRGPPGPALPRPGGRRGGRARRGPADVHGPAARLDVPGRRGPAADAGVRAGAGFGAQAARRAAGHAGLHRLARAALPAPAGRAGLTLLLR